MSTHRTVSVVVCTHHVGRLTRVGQAVDSIQRQDLQADEIIVVVDGDDTLVDVVQRSLSGVRVIRNNRRRGLSGARNTGVLAASGEVIAFLDDDAVADRGWLHALVARFDSPFVMGVGGPIRPRWPDRRPRWMPHEFDWVVGCSFDGQAKTPDDVRNLIGCNMAFRRSAVLLAGMFAEELGRVGADAAGVEETEICIRMGAMFPSAKLVLDDSAAVTHHIEKHRTAFRYFARRCIAEGRSKALMTKRHPAQVGLSSERRHLLTTIPRRVGAHLVSGFARPGQGGFARAAASCAGTALVVASFLIRRLTVRGASEPDAIFAPIKVVDVDIGKPLEAIPATAAEGRAYGSAHLVIRDDVRLVGTVLVPLFGEELPASRLAGVVAPYRSKVQHSLHTMPGEPVRVVVATRDRPESLARCLDSLLHQDYPNFEIVVVDNAPSTDATRDTVERRYAATGKVIYQVERRPGLSNAHNRGLEGLAAGIVAFTDDDVVADRAWLSNLVRPFGEDAGVGCVTGGIVPAELETRAQYWTEQHGGFLKYVERRDFRLNEGGSDNPLFPYAAGMFGSGANMAFRRSALADIGGFDPALGAGTLARGGDDLAAFADVVLAGHRLTYSPDALVWHYHRRGEDGMRRQAFGYGVGLGAYLTRLVLTRPHQTLHFLLAAPAAMRHLLGKKSAKNARLSSTYPRGLVWLERLGILAGAPAYLRSRRAARHDDRRGGTLSGVRPVWKST